MPKNIIESKTCQQNLTKINNSAKISKNNSDEKLCISATKT